MYRLLPMFVAAVIALQSAFSQADSARMHDLPGKDDSRLQQAINAWLSGETLGPISELADLARDGNVAARLLLWKLESRSYEDLPGLSSEERHRLYRPPSDGGFPKRWSKTEELRELPFLMDWWKVAKEMDPEVWLDHARRMIDAGEREHVLQGGAWRLTHHPFLAEFFDEATTIDDYQKVNIWLTRWHAHLAAELPLGAPEYWFKGWTGPPWAAEHEAMVRKAFREKRLAALRFLRWRNRSASARGYFIDRTHDRSMELLDWLKGGTPKMPPPTPVERHTAGALLVAEARHGTYLTPLLDICEARCARTVETCMYAGVVHTGGLAGLTDIGSPLEAIISQDRWRSSFRARQDVLYRARHRLEFLARERARGVTTKLPPGGCFAQFVADAKLR